MIMIDRGEAEAGARFRVGQVVQHRRYGYRGVVVHFDASCQADEDWYQSNQTQPKREQPWYSVLVDGGTHTTYAAEENLIEEPSGRPIAHPLLAHFFSAFVDGVYVRNDEPWPRWS